MEQVGTGRSLGEGRGQTKGRTAPLLSLLILGVGTPPPAGGASEWDQGRWPRTSRVKPCPLAGPKVPPEMDKAGGSTLSRTDCHAHRLAEELLPYVELCPALVQGDWALKAGGPRSSSLGG